MDISKLIGSSPDQLTIAQRRELAGQWVAFEIYTPKNLALRKIEAVGPSVAVCITQLQQRGLDPSLYEYLPLTPAY